MLIVFVTCIDDLIGTDNAAVAEELEQSYPGLYVIFCHMNPITDDRPDSPMVSIHKSIYQLLGRLGDGMRDAGVNASAIWSSCIRTVNFTGLPGFLGFRLSGISVAVRRLKHLPG